MEDNNPEEVLNGEDTGLDENNESGMKLNTIYNEDCLVGMSRIPDGSVDLIISDLPYGVTKNKWDSVIPLDELWKHYKRVIKENGAIVLFGQGMFTARIMLSNEKWYRYNLIWEKDRPTGFLNAKKMPLRSHEDIVVFYKKLPTYNPQFWEGKPLHGMGNKFRNVQSVNNNYGKFDRRKNPSAKREGDTKKYPRSVLSFKKEHPPIHPTQKSVELVEWLVKTYSNKGDTVLDSCMGSGTTAIACLNTDRQFIGFELDEEYHKLSLERIENHKQQLGLI